MAKLNQTQRDYFKRRVESIQSEKRTTYMLALKATLPDLDLDNHLINAETIRAGKYRIKTPEEILANLVPNGYNNNSPYVRELVVKVTNPAAEAAKVIYERKMAEYDRLMHAQQRRFNDQIMLGGDETALAALASLEAEEIVLPD